MSRVVIRISSDAMKMVKARAKAKDCTEGEAADALIKTANGRNAAVARYTAKPAKKAKRKAGPAVKKAAPRKPAPKPKAAKKRVRKPKAAPAPVVEASETVEQTELN